MQLETLTEPMEAVDPSRSLAEAEAFLRTLSELETQAWIAQLSDNDIAGIHRNRFLPLYLNLATIFREEYPQDHIRHLAAEATRSSIWSHRAVERFLATVADGVSSQACPDLDQLLHFPNWDTALLNSLLARGRGLIICTYRLGLYSFVVPDLALLGFPVSYLLLEAKAEPLECGLMALRERLAACPAGPSSARVVENLLHLQPISASRPDAAVTLAGALAKGGIAAILPDANSGADGVWGQSSRISLDFFGFQIAVKSGPARLSVLTGAPILPVVAIKDGVSSGKLVFGEPLVPPVRSGAAARENYVQDAMQSLYEFLQTHARQVPEQWEGAAAVHRWRQTAPDQAARGCEDSGRYQAEVTRELESGCQYRINHQRVVALHVPGGELWVDSETLKSVKPPASAAYIFRALAEPSGVHLDWINALERCHERPQIISLLAQLRSRGYILSMRDAGPAHATCFEQDSPGTTPRGIHPKKEKHVYG